MLGIITDPTLGADSETDTLDDVLRRVQVSSYATKLHQMMDQAFPITDQMNRPAAPAGGTPRQPQTANLDLMATLRKYQTAVYLTAGGLLLFAILRRR